MTEAEVVALLKHLRLMRDVYYSRPELAGIVAWASRQIVEIEQDYLDVPAGIVS